MKQQTSKQTKGHLWFWNFLLLLIILSVHSLFTLCRNSLLAVVTLTPADTYCLIDSNLYWKNNKTKCTHNKKHFFCMIEEIFCCNISIFRGCSFSKVRVRCCNNKMVRFLHTFRNCGVLPYYVLVLHLYNICMCDVFLKTRRSEIFWKAFKLTSFLGFHFFRLPE